MGMGWGKGEEEKEKEVEGGREGGRRRRRRVSAPLRFSTDGQMQFSLLTLTPDPLHVK